MCIQQSPYKVVEDGSNEGGHQYQSLGLNKTLKQNTPQVHLMLKKMYRRQDFLWKKRFAGQTYEKCVAGNFFSLNPDGKSVP